MGRSADSHSDRGGYPEASYDNDNKGTIGHMDRRMSVGVTPDDVLNPLTGMSTGEVIEEADAFVNQFGFESDREVFRRGALVAQNPKGFETINELSQDEKNGLAHERDHIWSQTRSLMFSGK